MDCSNLARCSGGILASRSGGMSDPLVRVVILISHVPGLTSKESASAKDVIRGMKEFGMSPTTVSITAPLSIQALPAVVVLLQYKTDDSDERMETGYTVTSIWPIVGR